MKTKMDSYHEKLMAIMKAGQEKTEVTDLEANPEEIKFVMEHQKAPKEEAAMETVGELVNRYWDRHLALRRRRQLRKLTLDDGGFRKKLGAACRRMTAMPFLHGLRDTVVRDQAGTVLQEAPLKDGRSRGDDGRARNATRK
jgi:hypothetical protein